MTEPNYPVNNRLTSASKAAVATVTTVLGLLTLFAADIGDGSIGSGEVGGLVTAGITAVVTVIGVWAKRNREL